MKKTKNKKKTGRSSETLFSSLKGAIWGVIISVASVLVLAIIVKQGGVANEAISVINQIVKTLSIVVAAFIAVRSAGDKKIQSGVWGGLLYGRRSFGRSACAFDGCSNGNRHRSAARNHFRQKAKQSGGKSAEFFENSDGGESGSPSTVRERVSIISFSAHIGTDRARLRKT